MSTQLYPVAFREDVLFLVEHNGEPYTPLRPISDSLGLEWSSQVKKLNRHQNLTVVTLTTVAGDGNQREMLCLPLRKLPAYLYSIDLRRVRKEIRDKVVLYQTECDDVLWNYWTRGHAINPRQEEEHNALDRKILTQSLQKLAERYDTLERQFTGLDAEYDLLMDQYENVAEELLKARPLWDQIDRYKDMGLDWEEIARLVGCSSTKIRCHYKAMQECGLVPKEEDPQLSLLEDSQP